jgi:hypothetical protein
MAMGYLIAFLLLTLYYTVVRGCWRVVLKGVWVSPLSFISIKVNCIKLNPIYKGRF